MTASIYDRLDRTYTGELTRSDTTRRELARWRDTVPALAGLTAPADLPYLVDDNADAVLGALLDLHQSGSQLAGTLLLHQMLPKLRRITRYARIYHNCCRHEIDDERRSAVVTAFLAVIADYRGRTGLAGALALRTLGAITAPHAPTAREVPIVEEVLHDLVDRERDARGSCSAEITGDVVLKWALAEQVITADERELLVRAYLTEDATIAALANALGVPYALLRQRLHRLVARIRTAVFAHVAAPNPAAHSPRSEPARPAPQPMPRVA